jgi:hypothetical protein
MSHKIWPFYRCWGPYIPCPCHGQGIWDTWGRIWCGTPTIYGYEDGVSSLRAGTFGGIWTRRSALSIKLLRLCQAFVLLKMHFAAIHLVSIL